MNLAYDIELDHRVWVPIPLEFPWNGYEGVDAWAGDLSSSLLDGFDASPEVRDRLQSTARALAVTEGPLPGAIERFWHFPEFGGPERLVHLYAAEYPFAVDTIAELGDLARSGVGGIVQVLEPVTGTSFDHAARAVVITAIPTGDAAGDAGTAGADASAPAAATPEQTIFVERFLGLASGFVFILELVEANSTALELLEEPLETLFRSIRLRVDAGEDAAP